MWCFHMWIKWWNQVKIMYLIKYYFLSKKEKNRKEKEIQIQIQVSDPKSWLYSQAQEQKWSCWFSSQGRPRYPGYELGERVACATNHGFIFGTPVYHVLCHELGRYNCDCGLLGKCPFFISETHVFMIFQLNGGTRLPLRGNCMLLPQPFLHILPFL